ncbi:unnamed protein product, partial [Protopolystoma xenopodis]
MPPLPFFPPQDASYPRNLAGGRPQQPLLAHYPIAGVEMLSRRPSMQAGSSVYSGATYPASVAHDLTGSLSSGPGFLAPGLGLGLGFGLAPRGLFSGQAASLGCASDQGGSLASLSPGAGFLGPHGLAGPFGPAAGLGPGLLNAAGGSLDGRRAPDAASAEAAAAMPLAGMGLLSNQAIAQ